MATESIHREEKDEMSVKEVILSVQVWLKYLLANWRTLLIAGALGCALGLGYSYWKEPIFTATTTFVLESNDSRSGLGRLAGVASIVGIDLGASAGGLFQGDNLLELYKSRTMLAQTLLSKIYPDSSELLIERYIRFNNLREDWEDDKPEMLTLDFRVPPSQLDPATLRLREGLISSIVGKINSEILTVDKPDKSLSIIKVEVKSPDEVFSKTFNENLVSRVNEFYTQTKVKKSTDNIAILERKVDSVRAEMTGAIYSVAQATDETPNLNPTRQSQRIVPTQKAQFSAETNKTILGQLLQNLELTKLALLQEQPLIQLVDQPVYPLQVSRVGNLKGMIVGGFLFLFLTLGILISFKYYRDVMAE